MQKEEANRYFLNQNNLPRLDEQLKAELDSELNIEDVAKAVMALPNGKAPGTDGFPVGFYKVFWPKIKLWYMTAWNMP